MTVGLKITIGLKMSVELLTQPSLCLMTSNKQDWVAQTSIKFKSQLNLILVYIYFM